MYSNITKLGLNYLLNNRRQESIDLNQAKYLE